MNLFSKGLVFFLVLVAFSCTFSESSDIIGEGVIHSQEITSDATMQACFEKEQSNVQVCIVGTVTKLLSDDNQGVRHQRFIVSLGSGQTILVAHNIDLANRITSLSENDEVTIFGEYEWNPQGGIIHWTHHDPNGQHLGGWIIHKNKTYE